MRITVILAAMIAALPALAHSWYPLACCGNMDCFPVDCDQLVETGSGWLYVPTGNLFKREQVQPSHDHHCHCASGMGAITAQSARSSCQTFRSGRAPNDVIRLTILRAALRPRDCRGQSRKYQTLSPLQR
jgi:hypothetical protein